MLDVTQKYFESIHWSRIAPGELYMPYRFTVQLVEYRTHVLLVAQGALGMPWRVARGLWPLAALSLSLSQAETVCREQRVLDGGDAACSVACHHGTSMCWTWSGTHSTGSHYIQDLWLFAQGLHNHVAAKCLFCCSWLVGWWILMHGGNWCSMAL